MLFSSSALYFPFDSRSSLPCPSPRSITLSFFLCPLSPFHNVLSECSLGSSINWPRDMFYPCGQGEPPSLDSRMNSWSWVSGFIHIAKQNPIQQGSPTSRCHAVTPIAKEQVQTGSGFVPNTFHTKLHEVPCHVLLSPCFIL